MRGKIDWMATEREADARAKGYAKYAQEGTLPELYKIYYDNKGLPYFYSRSSDKYSMNNRMHLFLQPALPPRSF